MASVPLGTRLAYKGMCRADAGIASFKHYILINIPARCLQCFSNFSTRSNQFACLKWGFDTFTARGLTPQIQGRAKLPFELGLCVF